MKCTLCGNQFEWKEKDIVCSGCPFEPECKLIRCPRCGFEWPLTGYDKSVTVPLSHMKLGESGQIVNICTLKTEHVKKIISLGLMPGMNVRLIRTFPTLLCQIEYSQFALDREIASYVVVKRKEV
ncbi:ferrous iron transport protein A [Candidatus Roizmanbacteria bacterium]|nr:ferrous iron transport protein A [Candidatus Roizmanbacteria bacterium]